MAHEYNYDWTTETIAEWRDDHQPDERQRCAQCCTIYPCGMLALAEDAYAATQQVAALAAERAELREVLTRLLPWCIEACATWPLPDQQTRLGDAIHAAQAALAATRPTTAEKSPTRWT